MKLADLLLQENEGLARDQLMLLRHAEKEVTLLKQCGATVEEFTAVQPVNDVYDFLLPSRPAVKVVGAVVGDRLFAVYEVGEVLAEGLSTAISSLEYQRFELSRRRDDGTQKPIRHCRKYALELLPSGALEACVTGWEGRTRTPVQRWDSGFFDEIEVDALPISSRPIGETMSGDSEWLEGNRALRTHLTRERSAGLARAKKIAFARQHGRLFCERCKLDPVKTYGTKMAEACIEVHHATTQVHDMGERHITRLGDLQCLCANCHRLTHARLRASGG